MAWSSQTSATSGSRCDAVTRIVIHPPSRFDLPRPAELWEAREIFVRFGQRDIILRYRQTAIGVAWVLIQPLLAAGIFAVVFGQVAKLPSNGVPYFVFAYAGTLGWNLFSSMLNRSAPSLVANQSLVSKVFFPRMVVPLATSLSVLLDFLVALVLGLVLVVVNGLAGWHLLLVLWWALMALLFGAGIGLAASAVMVRYRDVAYVLPFLVQVGLYASPVGYALTSVPERLRPLFDLNPMTWVLEGFRHAMLGQSAPPMGAVVGTAVASIVVFVLGALVFQQQERSFADII